jgi:hypothetical protein
VGSATHDRFINVNITIPDLDVKTAFRIGANPCFEMDSGSLTTVIG